MDPITAIGLLASLSNLIEASNSLLTIIKSFKDGDQELLGLFNDVLVYAEALKGFDRVLRSRQSFQVWKLNCETNEMGAA